MLNQPKLKCVLHGIMIRMFSPKKTIQFLTCFKGCVLIFKGKHYSLISGNLFRLHKLIKLEKNVFYCFPDVYLTFGH
jgi:hypothetical protein